ncbi:MAG: Gfo/Idh/MocA family oxidoreductase [Candidatus Omnitrophica bacterium]|nr:Gfo/Idh/MocA family oxidoreductase [Candidatus Omnitrophota bacterium]
MGKREPSIKIGIIGCGYWGPNLVRNFSAVDDCYVKFCCDIDANRLRYIQRLYPFLEVTREYQKIIDSPDVDVIVIATPVSTHFPIAIKALNAGKDVWIEKPMTTSVKEAQILIKEAEKRKRIIFVDHTFIYTGAIRKIKEIIKSNALGRILYFDSVRINLGLFQHDVNVVWDLAPHDLSIMDYLLEKTPVGIYATGVGHYNNDIENIAYLSVKFDSDMLAHFHFNWLAPVKIRQILVCGSEKMILYNDMEPSEKVKVFDRGVTINQKKKENIYQTLVSYRTGDIYSPKIDTKEALSVACEHFIDCVKLRKSPITDGYSGLRVTKMIEASQRSIKKKEHWEPI